MYTILYKSSRFKQIIFSKYATNLKTTISQRSLNATNWVAKILGLEKAELVAIPTISNWFIHQLTHLSLRPVQFVETWFKFKLNISVIFKSRKVRSLNVVNPRFLEIILYWRPSLQLQRWKSNSRGYPVHICLITVEGNVYIFQVEVEGKCAVFTAQFLVRIIWLSPSSNIIHFFWSTVVCLDMSLNKWRICSHFRNQCRVQQREN